MTNDVTRSGSTAVQAMRAGANDARAKAQQLVPVVQQTVGKALYGTCYTVSFAVVFPTMLVASFIPTNNVVARGMIDGARAARRSVNESAARRSARRQERRAARASGIAEDGAEALAPA